MGASYTYHKGDSGRVVRDVQGVLGVTVDGIFGPKTEAALVAWQRANRLVPDGIIGPVTLAKMHRELIAGVDVSHYQPPLNWGAAAASGVRFAYVKASEGQTYRDSSTRGHVDGARGAGLKVGLYHFATASSIANDPEAEAAWFRKVATEIGGAFDLPPVLDIESNPQGLSQTALTEWVLRFCQTTTDLWGRRPMVYTYTAFLPSFARDPRLAAYPLWIARYTTKNDPGPVAPWVTWDVWQWSVGDVVGAKGKTDRNWLAGGTAGLDALCALK